MLDENVFRKKKMVETSGNNGQVYEKSIALIIKDVWYESCLLHSSSLVDFTYNIILYLSFLL